MDNTDTSALETQILNFFQNSGLTQTQVNRAVRSLQNTIRYGQILALRNGDNTYPEIETMTGIPAGTARSIVSRGGYKS